MMELFALFVVMGTLFGLSASQPFGMNASSVLMTSPSSGVNPRFFPESTVVSVGTPAGNMLLVFGGFAISSTSSAVPSNAFRMFDAKLSLWSQIVTTDTIPTARAAHSAVVIHNGGNPLMCVFGNSVFFCKNGPLLIRVVSYSLFPLIE
jgi:hypothetical protein